MTAIRALHADRVRIPLRRPFPTATGMWLEHDAWIIRLVDADGRVGLGEAALDSGAGEVASRILTSLIRELVSQDGAVVLPAMADLELHGAPGRALNAAIESALVDLRGGPVSPRIRPDGPGIGVNATIPSLGPASAAQAAVQSVESGFATLKIKAGAERETDVLVDRIRAIRTAVGPAVRLRIDVNGAWDVATAQDRLRAIAGFDIEYVEQPVPAHDTAGLADLRRRARIPIAVDEAASSVAAVRALLAAEAADVVVVKLARVGGPAAAAEIAERAAEHGVPVVVSTLFETGIGIASALAAVAVLPEVRLSGTAEPPAHGLATGGLLEHDLLAESLIVEHGRMHVASRRGSGGLGVVLDGRALERFRAEAVGAPA